MKPRILQYDSSGAGAPLVLVPGGLTGWLSWLPHQERLAVTRRVIRVKPIHNELGSAGRPGDPAYTAATEREALRLTLDALAIDAADFAGWSGGGRAVLEFALAYPARVRILTLVEPSAAWVLDGPGERDAEVEAMEALLHGLAGAEVTEDDLARFLGVAGFLQAGEDARRLPAWPRWLPHRTALSWQSARLDRPQRAVAELGRITQPVLLVKGTASAGWLRRVVDVLGQRLPRATVLELEGNHACHIQSMEAFLEAMQEHLSSAAPVSTEAQAKPGP